MRSPKSERASRLVDAMLGVSLMTQGLAEVGQAGASQAMIVVALAGGASILAGTIVRRRFEHRLPHFDAAVTLIEAVMCAFVGAAAARRGTSYIQYAWLVAAVAFTGAAVVKFRQGLRSRALSMSHDPATPEQAGDGQSEDVPVLVFEGPYAEVLFVQTLIESAGIATNVTDQMRGGRVGFDVRLFVRQADAEHATEIVADFRRNGRRSAY